MKRELAQPETTDDEINLHLGAEATQALRKAAALMDVSTYEAARRMIGDFLFLRQHIAKGWRVVLERHGRYREVDWHD